MKVIAKVISVSSRVRVGVLTKVFVRIRVRFRVF